MRNLVVPNGCPIQVEDIIALKQCMLSLKELVHEAAIFNKGLLIKLIFDSFILMQKYFFTTKCEKK